MPMSAMRWERRGFVGESCSGGFGCGKSLWSNCNRVGTTGGDGALCILGEEILL